MKYREKMSPSERRSLWMSRLVIWITMVVVIFPALWIVMSSFSAGDSFFLSSLFPQKLSTEHYVKLFTETNFVLWVWNSLKLCLIVAVIQLVLTSLAASYREPASHNTSRHLMYRLHPASLQSFHDPHRRPRLPAPL